MKVIVHFCKNFCQIHGVSKQLFTAVWESDNPFLCLYCLLACYQKEIVSVSEQILQRLLSLKVRTQCQTLMILEAESLHTNATNADQSSHGHPHTTPSQDYQN